MALSNTIEFITSLVRPTGGQLVSQAHRQDVIPYMPPGQSILYTTYPDTGLFAMIVYMYRFGDMTPNVWTYRLNYTGGLVSSGVLTRDFMSNPIDFFMVVTQKYPIKNIVQNLDNVPHYWEANMFYLTVATQPDLEAIGLALADRDGQSQYLKEITRVLKGKVPSQKTPTPVYVP